MLDLAPIKELIACLKEPVEPEYQTLTAETLNAAGLPSEISLTSSAKLLVWEVNDGQITQMPILAWDALRGIVYGRCESGKFQTSMLRWFHVTRESAELELAYNKAWHRHEDAWEAKSAIEDYLGRLVEEVEALRDRLGRS